MVDFSLLLLPGSHAAGVAVSLDLLAAAVRLAPGLGLAAPRWRVLAPQGGTLELSSGLRLETQALPTRADRSIWVLPGLGLDSPERLQSGLAQPDAERSAQSLARHAAQGGHCAASCSAVFLLQRAGLLAGRQVTTSWWLAPLLQQWAPEAHVRADALVLQDGPLWTAGAALAQADLMLALLTQGWGPALVDRLRRFLLLPPPRATQSPYVLPALVVQGDELLRRLTRCIETQLPRPPTLDGLAAALGLSPRTLSRRVRAASGRTVLDWVQAVRLNRARFLIETSRLPIETVAAAVGYQDGSALRRMMRRSASARPSQFRLG
ncbi:transcriptional regulator GlxA family with amidase domain [Inhella inkyongensis]|uniref:Transcriptional regulator GlxA family with amidase domain n=1 Tax=Inhella inkyongensis TaxID=392593 RepID=A0A840S5T1_9BURK|nr:helix-turn-helix domain-containing protein [Inhella inkyongensis]MBB5204932.1 transcriptional regulator GlxA family with amidase domain [Inhella inkyongensis]